MLCAVIAINWDRWISSRTWQRTTDAQLQSDLVPLSALVAAPVLHVPVDDFQMVQAGDLLVELDPRVYAAQLAQAEANVDEVQRAIDLVRAQQSLQQANIAAASANVAGVKATQWRNELEDQRQRQLLQSGIVGTEQQVQQADAAFELASAQVAQANAAVEAAQRQLDVLKRQEAQLGANLESATAQRNLARINMGYTRITAPVAGLVSRRLVYPGQYVAVGMQVITVAPLPKIYVIANYREVQLTNLRMGQRALITVDSFPGITLQGHVVGWSPGTGSEFALLPPDNATGNFTKVVQRVPVKVALDTDDGLGDRLRAGMSVEVTIDMKSTTQQ